MIFSDTLFNLQGEKARLMRIHSSHGTHHFAGLVNAILLFTTHRLIPDPSDLPTVAPRKVIDLSSSAAMGITPFILTASESKPASPKVVVEQRFGNENNFEAVPPPSASKDTPHRRDSDTLSIETYRSMNSQTPLNKESP